MHTSVCMYGPSHAAAAPEGGSLYLHPRRDAAAATIKGDGAVLEDGGMAVAVADAQARSQAVSARGRRGRRRRLVADAAVAEGRLNVVVDCVTRRRTGPMIRACLPLWVGLMDSVHQLSRIDQSIHCLSTKAQQPNKQG